MNQPYQSSEPSRTEVEAFPGLTVLEFGNDWCGHCQAAQVPVQQALSASSTAVRHLKIADGSGRPLGRSFRVKLWPTLVFLRDGQERARVVRPTATETIWQALEQATQVSCEMPSGFHAERNELELKRSE